MSKTKLAEQRPVKLYRSAKSGHCHRVQLMLSLLEIPYETIELDMANGAHKAADYLMLSPLGEVPAIEDDGVVLSDSNAIITYLAERYSDAGKWRGATPVEAGEVQRWLSIAAGEIAAGPCAARLVTVFGASLDHEAAKAKSRALFKLMDAHLKDRDWLAADRTTLADIAGYSYVAHAPEGGVGLTPYPKIRAWLARIEALPNFVGMARSPVLA
ncbi:glutathione S-transferase family protein [Aurantimonas sp. HBX-1]|uniref:glutathione S-transferase family protein n=1 Tax=Aurantimonas sp. HBX-1 TaxID=2906072 RepID=UPI001F29764A|nr:glutathione S-transferase [Aurantimonas sp. HBX-1]UIJ73461.1 glutathione S-transferase [Aurantimonas sp. HBX-1]